MRLSEPTTKYWTKIDPYYQQQICRPLTLVSGDKKFVRIFAGVLWGGGVKRRWLIENVDFLGFGRYVFGTLGNEANIIIQCYLVPCRLSSDLDGLFGVKFCFRAGLAGWYRATSDNNCVKTNKDRHILSAVQIFGRDSSFWRYKVCADIRSGSLERRR